MNDLLEVKIRQDIYQLIVKNPGLHARKISELLHLSGQLTDYHLLCMERHEVISSVKEEGFRRYYIKGILGVKDRRRISILYHETPLKIVLFLFQHPNTTHKEILDQVAVAKSTLSYHLKKLEKHGILIAELYSTEKRYRIIDEDDLMDLLIRYKPYSRIESMKDIWADLQWPGTQ